MGDHRDLHSFPTRRSSDLLPQGHRSATYISAEKISVHGFKHRRRGCLASEHAIAEAGSESFNLRLDAVGHVDRGRVGHVAVRPECVLVLWCARGIEKAGLRNEHEGAFGMSAMGYVVFSGSNLLEGSTKMEADGTATLRRAPRNRCGKCA